MNKRTRIVELMESTFIGFLLSGAKVSWLWSFIYVLTPPTVKPFRLRYWPGGLGGGGGCHPPLEILTIACLTFCLLLTDRPTLGLPEYKLKVVNICKMHKTGGLEVVVL